MPFRSYDSLAQTTKKATSPQLPVSKYINTSLRCRKWCTSNSISDVNC